jgi:hypothetical protein
MSTNNYNNEQNVPSSNMRINEKMLKHVLLVADWVLKKDESPTLIKSLAKELKERTDKYCQKNYTQVYDEIERINKMDIERF